MRPPREHRACARMGSAPVPRMFPPAAVAVATAARVERKPLLPNGARTGGATMSTTSVVCIGALIVAAGVAAVGASVLAAGGSGGGDELRASRELPADCHADAPFVGSADVTVEIKTPRRRGRARRADAQPLALPRRRRARRDPPPVRRRRAVARHEELALQHRAKPARACSRLPFIRPRAPLPTLPERPGPSVVSVTMSWSLGLGDLVS